MIHRPHLRRWASSRDGSYAVELSAEAFLYECLPYALVRGTPEVDNAAFVIVNVEGADSTSVFAIADAFRRECSTSRLSLAASATALQKLVDLNIDLDRISLMLDQVDVATPLSEIIRDRIDSIRFCPDFVAQAASHIRIGFVLESMLALSRDLGACSLGPAPRSERVGLIDRFAFDYLDCPTLDALAAAAAVDPGYAINPETAPINRGWSTSRL